MRIGICTSIEQLGAASEAGYDFAELTITGSLASEQDESVFAPMRKKIAASPIPIEVFNCLFPGKIKVNGPQVDLPAVTRYLHTALGRVAECGAQLVVFGSGGARRIPDDYPPARGWEQLAEITRIAGDIAGRHNITIVMEPLLTRACNLFQRVDQGVAFVDRLNHPHVKLLADLFHMAAENEPFENLVTAGSRLKHIHLATPAIPETGEGTAYDFKGFFNALRRAGYTDRVSIEDNPGLIARQTAPLVETYRAIRLFLLKEAAI